MTFSLPSRPSVGSTLHASKWQKLPTLLDVNEMRDLFSFLGQFWIVRISGLIPIGEEIISQEEFLDAYANYISSIKNAGVSTDSRLRSYFSAILTTFPDALYSVKINEEKQLIKVLQPVVQLQAHYCNYSQADSTFRSMVIGSVGCISWGLQFSYPHLYQDEYHQAITVREVPQFPNTALFKRLQQWIRHQTIAAPFIVEGKKVIVPIRLGKECLSWINSHPHLQLKNIQVAKE